MEEKVFEISLEIAEALPGVIAGGFAAGVFVVLAVSVCVSGFKALLHMIGR